jgi:hypothetical protein
MSNSLDSRIIDLERRILQLEAHQRYRADSGVVDNGILSLPPEYDFPEGYTAAAHLSREISLEDTLGPGLQVASPPQSQDAATAEPFSSYLFVPPFADVNTWASRSGGDVSVNLENSGDPKDGSINMKMRAEKNSADNSDKAEKYAQCGYGFRLRNNTGSPRLLKVEPIFNVDRSVLSAFLYEENDGWGAASVQLFLRAMFSFVTWKGANRDKKVYLGKPTQDLLFHRKTYDSKFLGNRKHRVNKRYDRKIFEPTRGVSGGLIPPGNEGVVYVDIWAGLFVWVDDFRFAVSTNIKANLLEVKLSYD